MAHKTSLTNPAIYRNDKNKPKKWKRWAELNGSFKQDKYFFTQHLVHIGDYVVTKPITRDEYVKLRHAAKAWAYRKDKQIKTEVTNLGKNLCKVKVMLISHHRERQYEF